MKILLESEESFSEGSLLVFEVYVCLDWISLKSKTHNEVGTMADDGDEDGHSCPLGC